LCAVYGVLELESATEGDTVCRDLLLARIIEPTSKFDTARALGEIGVKPTSYSTIKRKLPAYAKPSWRRALAAATAAHAGLGPASLVLFGVSTPAARSQSWWSANPPCASGSDWGCSPP
jgi:hypothetical protein